MAAPTILIVEDGPVDAIVLRNILAHAGFHILAAGDGKEALRTLEDHPEVALVMADVRMPEMDGVELVTAMRGRAELAGVPVIFVSGASDADTVRKAASLHPAGYILKPVTEPSRVLDRVTATLKTSSPVLEDSDVVSQRNGFNSTEYRDACVALARLVRTRLQDGGGRREPAPGDLAVRARAAGARRLEAALARGDDASRELRGTLNVLEAQGY